MKTQDSESVKKLAQKARIIDFSEWQGQHSPEAIAIFVQADTESRYLTNADLERLGQLEPQGLHFQQAARLLREQAIDIVRTARTAILSHFPTIADAEGDLHPDVRSESCWRDLWHFLRCISYGIAANDPHYTSPVGLHYLELLYRELRVPIEAMTLGLVSLKVASLLRCPAGMYNELEPYFDHLIDQMRRFSQSKVAQGS